MSDPAIELHLVRHAHAGDPATWDGPDAARPLTPKGHRQAVRLGRVLREAEVTPIDIVTSPKVRALETADHIAAALDVLVHVDDRLEGPLDLATLAAILRGAGGSGRIILVGHDPDLSALCSELVGAPIHLRKGAAACVVLPSGPTAGTGHLRWLVPPEVLPR